ncbi:translocation/assembly module TamB [Carboxylicivirga sediminis]|uniref:Translocation/assembly module TamB n=1 Tax=Carboxylicivirga sediminis TaxID=2006564 RepID=A0A941F5G9_9BACT|nr:translocation/assembly module TamB domain-containing protein [Carboxylicivirga sediminis]MBR8536299.1 translocation/assembly module TamB [Carboxylicivirga sediminis]
MAGLLLVPLLLYSVLLLPAVQTSVVNYVTAELSEDLNTDITIKRVHFRPFKTLVLDDIVIYDQHKDTLLVVERVSANIDSLYFRSKELYVGLLSVQGPDVNIQKEDSVYNYSFLTKRLVNRRTGNSKWTIGLRDLEVENGTVDYAVDSLSRATTISEINLLLHDLRKDSLWRFDIKEFGLKNPMHLNLEKVEANVAVGDSCLFLNKALISTGRSSLHIDSLALEFNKGEKGLEQIGSFYADVRKSDFSEADIVKISPLKRAANIGLSGVVYGTVNNIKGRNARIYFGPHSQLVSSFDISGLPNIDETFLYLKVSRLSTTPSDLEQLFSHVKGQALTLPAAINSLNEINYQGNFTGFLTDMVAYGEFTTALGQISTDIGLKIDSQDDLVFSGNLKTQQFDIGQLAGAEEYVGKVSMAVAINGRRRSTEQFDAYLSGVIDTLSINKYDYKNIRLNGLFENNKFDGDFLIDDPNGQVGFNGKIDLSGDIPNFSFNAHLTDIKLDRLNLYSKHKNSSLTVDVETDISGKDLNDIVGFMHLDNFSYLSDDHDVAIDSLLLISVREGERKRVVLQSDIAEGDLVGVYNFTHIGSLLKKNLTQYLPALTNSVNIKEKELTHNDFTFSCTFKRISEIAAVLAPGISVSDEGLLLGSYNSSQGEMDVEVELQYIDANGLSASHPEVHISSGQSDELDVVSRFRELSVDKLGTFQNLSFHHSAHNDTVDFNIFWNNWDDYTNSGSILTTTTFKARDNGVYATCNFHPSYIMVRDSLWEIQPTTLHYHPDGFSMKNFRVHHGNQEVGINGFAHRHVKDGLRVHLQNISLSDIIGYQNLQQVQVSGALSGTLDFQNIYKSPVISGDLAVDGFVFNDDEVGDFSVVADYQPKKNQLNVQANVVKDEKQSLIGGGYIDLAQQQLNMNFDIDQLEIGFLNLYLSRIMQNLTGTASGQIAVVGALSSPELLGKLRINKAFFDVGLLKTTYSVADSVIFEPNEMIFKNLLVADRNGKQGSFNGTIHHTAFRNMSYNLSLIANNMLVMDTKYSDNPLYYGEVYADGNMAINGTTKDLIIDIAGRTRENTEFFIPLTDEESAEESSFIRFINPVDETDTQRKEGIEVSNEYDIDLTGMTVSMDLDITPDARCQVIFDSTVGDILRGSGNGNLQVKMDKEGGINFYGDFNFDNGDYMFTLRNVLNKKFVINQGSSINWDGNPYDANIDLNATYKLKTSLLDLIGDYSDESQRDFGRRIPVNCNLLLSDRLTQPNVKFEIKTPSSQDYNQNIIDAYINTEEETNRQVLSLLVLNKFYTTENASANNPTGLSAGNNAALVTTTEMLSNQLSHWLSQISRDIDIGVSYRPASEMTDDEVEVALSTQMFNNRVLVNGNVGYGQDQTRPSNLIGDFDVEVKLNKSGSLRAKAYTHTNNDLIYSSDYNVSPTTQGVGVSFREEFDTLEELMHKYWLKISGQNKKKAEQGQEKEEEETKD